jgi:hypothetical protein
MKKQLSLLLLLIAISVQTTIAQGKYAFTFDDLNNNHWVSVDNMMKTSRSDGQKMWSGGGDYIFETPDDKTNSIIKKKALFVMYGDSIYVNLHSLKCDGARFGNNYIRGQRYDDEEICFVTMRVGISAGSLFFGAIGAAVTMKNRIEHPCIYRLSSNDPKSAKIMDEHFMKRLLSDKPDLLKKYETEKDKETAKTIIPYLKELKLIQGSN